MTASTKDPEASLNSDSKSKNWCKSCGVFTRFAVFFLCLVLFFFHGYFLITFYLSFSTQIATNLTYSEVFDLPGLTLCFKSDQLTSPPASADEVFRRNFNEKEETNDVKCNLMIPTLNQITGSVESSPMPCKDVAPVMKSINYGMNQKCYTFFSRIGLKPREQRNLRVRHPRSGLINSRDGDILRLEIDFGKANLADDIEASVSIHHGNELPTSWHRVSKIKPGNKYITSFSKITEKRLPPPYETKCKNYGIKVDYAEDSNSNETDEAAGRESSVRSRYECIDQCLIDLYRQKCNCLPADINIRRQLLKPTDSFCTNPKCQQLRVHGQDVCEKLPDCKAECQKVMYSFFTEVSDPGTAQVLHYINSQGRGRPGFYAGRPMVTSGHGSQTYGLHVRVGEVLSDVTCTNCNCFLSRSRTHSMSKEVISSMPSAR